MHLSGATKDKAFHVGLEASRNLRLLCLDELQVVDIADAMILRSVIDGIMKSGTLLMMTSNRAPNELYMNGIQRSSFIPCIDLIQRKCEVLRLDAGKDYRMDIEVSPCSLLVGFNKINDEMLQRWSTVLSKGVEFSDSELVAFGRRIILKKTAGSCIMFDFAELFCVPMSSVDYLAIVKKFKYFIIKGVPAFRKVDMKEEARRFITFVDILYDARKLLVIQTECTLRDLFTLKSLGPTISQSEVADILGIERDAAIFTGAEERFSATRTISRLHEMTSRKWWHNNHGEMEGLLDII